MEPCSPRSAFPERAAFLQELGLSWAWAPFFFLLSFFRYLGCGVFWQQVTAGPGSGPHPPGREARPQPRGGSSGIPSRPGLPSSVTCAGRAETGPGSSCAAPRCAASTAGGHLAEQQRQQRGGVVPPPRLPHPPGRGFREKNLRAHAQPRPTAPLPGLPRTAPLRAQPRRGRTHPGGPGAAPPPPPAAPRRAPSICSWENAARSYSSSQQLILH